MGSLAHAGLPDSPGLTRPAVSLALARWKSTGTAMATIAQQSSPRGLGTPSVAPCASERSYLPKRSVLSRTRAFFMNAGV